MLNNQVIFYSVNNNMKYYVGVLSELLLFVCFINQGKTFIIYIIIYEKYRHLKQNYSIKTKM